MKRFLIITGWLAVLVVALFLRTAGIYRGLDEGSIYHPDEPKQVLALWRFLNDQYVAYIGNPFYDGYPYGLNHVDEYILRPYFRIKKAFAGHIMTNQSQDIVPDRSYLYYAARTLRVLYGMICLLIAWLIAKRLLFSRTASLFLLLILALAPLSVAVSHFATGDIGADLFGGLALLFLCLYAERSRNGWLFATGLAVGMAFACKYNGLLCGMAAGIYLLMKLISTRNWKAFLSACAILFAGTLAGMVILTPNLILDSRRALKDILANFAFIQQYGASDEYFQKSLAEKVFYVLTVNLPRIVRQAGWYVFVAALLGAVIATVRAAVRVFRNSESSDNVMDFLIFSIAVYPFAALFVSLIGKPMVQPFHFSYLQLPLAIGAVYGIGWLGGNVLGRHARIMVVVLMVVVVAELGVKARHDLFFWSKQDHGLLYNEMAWTVWNSDAMGRGKPAVVRDIFLEPESASVFRNRRREVLLRGGGFWNELQVMPVPPVPWPVQLDWIFMNGPLFPRSDRMFEVRADSSVTRHLVFRDPPEDVVIGIRSGSWPLEIVVNAGGDESRLRLLPDSQELISLAPVKWRTVEDRDPSGRRACIVPLNVKALVGDAYITVCANDAEAGSFLLFGGEAKKDVFDMPPASLREQIISEVNRARYLGDLDVKMTHLIIEASGGVGTDLCIIPERDGDRPVAFPLPCGVYKFEYDAVVMSEGTAEIEIWVGDFRSPETIRQCVRRVELPAGRNVMQYDFRKTFAPYQCCVVIKCIRGEVRIDSWRLTPDTAGIMNDLAGWDEGGIRPDWLSRCSDDGREVAGVDREVRFGRSIVLRGFSVPGKLEPGEPLKVRCVMELEKFPFAGLGEYFVFVHLLDIDGHQIHATGFPLTWALTGRMEDIICDGIIDEIGHGEYDVVMGIWNARTRRRMSVSARDIEKREKRKRYIRVGKTEF